MGERADLCALVPTIGTALDVACGLGSQTLWLAERGLHVTALDVSAVAIDRLRGTARAAELDHRVTARCVDLAHGIPPEPALVDVAVCQRYRDPALYSPLIARLAPGGIGVVTVLSAVGARGAIGPFHAPAGELSAAFAGPDIELLYHAERSGSATVVVAKRG